MDYAEKIITALQRGTINTRWRDFADIYLLAGRHTIDGTELQRALIEVSDHRRAEMSPLKDVLAGYAALAQPRWAAWRRKQHLEDRLLSAFNDVLAETMNFADPAITGCVTGLSWDPASRTWA